MSYYPLPLPVLPSLLVPAVNLLLVPVPVTFNAARSGISDVADPAVAPAMPPGAATPVLPAVPPAPPLPALPLLPILPIFPTLPTFPAIPPPALPALPLVTPLTCDVSDCHFIFPNEAAIIPHFNARHKGASTPLINRFAFRCVDCGIFFKSMVSMRSHVDKLHPARSTRLLYREYDADDHMDLPAPALDNDPGPLQHAAATITARTIPAFESLKQYAFPLGGLKRVRLASTLTTVAVRPFTAKVQSLMQLALQQHDLGNAQLLSNLFAHFIALPNATLALKRRSHAENTISSRIDAFTIDPQVNPLLPCVTAPADATPPDPDADSIRALPPSAALKCSLFVGQPLGLYLDRLMNPTPTASVSPDVALTQLLRLHPPRYSDLPLPLPPEDSPLLSSISLKRVTYLIRKRLRRGVTPGLDGWTQPLLSLFIDDSCCLRGLSLFVMMVCNGAILDPAIRAALLSSRLVAVPKPESDRVRPVAVGSVLLKLAAHVLLDSLYASLRRIFEPYQVGLFVRGGIETALLRTQLGLEAGAGDNVLVSLDLTNAFNARSRHVILDSLYCRPELASLFRLVHWLYGDSTPLHFFNDNSYISTLWSEEGVRQGDVLGSVLFALSIQDALQSSLQDAPDSLLIAVHDDITIVGPPAAAHRVFARIVANVCGPPEPSPTDVQLNSIKSLVFCPIDEPRLIEAVSCFNLPVRVGGCLKLLGSLIGLDSHARTTACTDLVRGRMDKLVSVLLSPDISAQLFFILLRLCALPAFGFLARTLPMDIFCEAATVVDEMVVKLVVSRLALPELTWHEGAQKQINLPLSYGGLGIVSLRRVSMTSFLCSLLEFLSRFPSIVLPVFSPTLNAAGYAYDALFHAFPTASFPAWLPGPDLFNSVVASATAVTKPLFQCQRQLQQTLTSVDNTAFLSYAQQLPIPSQASLHATRISLLRRFGPFDWLHVIPSLPSLRLPDPNFITCVRLRLGLPHQSIADLLCRFCSAQVDHVADPYHLLACAGQRNSGFTSRHDFLKHTVAAVARECGFTSRLESSYDKVLTKLPETLRMDIELAADNVGVLVDVSFTTSCSISKVTASAPTLATFPSHFLRERDDEKTAKYTKLAQALHMRFFPVIFDTLGVPGRFCSDFLSLLVARAVQSSSISPACTAAFSRGICARIAIAVQRVVFKTAFAPLAVPAFVPLPAAAYVL